MVPSPMSLQASQLSTNNQHQPTFGVIPRSSDLPKRTVFSPVSSNNLSSTLNQVQKNIEMMQVMNPQSSTTQPQLRMTSSISSHSLTPTSSMTAPHGTTKIDQQNKEILEKFNLKAPNIVSPIHGIAGDIFSSSFKHLDATAAGKNC